MLPPLIFFGFFFFGFFVFLAVTLVKGRRWARNVAAGIAAVLAPGGLLSDAAGRAAVVPRLGFVACVSILLLLATPQARAFFRPVAATPGSPGSPPDREPLGGPLG